MSKPEKPDQSALSREERLAVKLRENLHRRKAQARALNRPEDSPVDGTRANQGE